VIPTFVAAGQAFKVHCNLHERMEVVNWLRLSDSSAPTHCCEFSAGTSLFVSKTRLKLQARKLGSAHVGACSPRLGNASDGALNKELESEVDALQLAVDIQQQSMDHVRKA
jgi:hypothetical protein